MAGFRELHLFLADNFSSKEIISFSATVQILSYRGMVQIVDIEVCDTIPYAAETHDKSKILPRACREACAGITSVLRCKLYYGIV